MKFIKTVETDCDFYQGIDVEFLNELLSLRRENSLINLFERSTSPQKNLSSSSKLKT